MKREILIYILSLIFFLCISAAARNSNLRYEFVMQWGAKGDADGQFNSPEGIGVDSQGFIYVVDSGNYRIQKFDENGKFIMKWGTEGSTNGKFYYPIGLAIDKADNIYVADPNRIQKFDNKGNFLARFRGTTVDPQAQEKNFLNTPWGIALDKNGNIFVTDYYYNGVNIYKPDGTFIDRWGLPKGAPGAAAGAFQAPAGIAVDDANVYVVDRKNNRIQVFNLKGKYITQWKKFQRKINLNAPCGLFLDQNGFLFVADTENRRIQVFNPKSFKKTGLSGLCIGTLDTWTGGDGAFTYPCHMTADVKGNLYVTDNSTHRIYKFSLKK